MWPMMRIGPAAIQTAYVVWLAALWIAFEVVARTGRRYHLPSGFVESVTWRGLLAGVAAARLGYVFRFWDAYRHDLLAIVSPLPDTLDWRFGTIGVVLMVGVMTWRRGIPWRSLLDALAPGAAILLAGMAVADLVRGTSLGLPTDVPWAVELWDVRRHPVQLYIALPVLALAIWRWLNARPRPFPGFDFLMVAGGSALVVMISSAWREPDALWFGLRQEAILGWGVLLVVAGLGARWASEAVSERGGLAGAGDTP